MPAIVVCAACSTKLKVPEGTSAKALKCPKCKGIVPIVQAAPKPVPPPPKAEEEFEVNDAVDEKDEEFEVNEAAGDEEHEVNEAVDEEPTGETSGTADPPFDEDSALAELGFLKVDDVFTQAGIPHAARKAFEKAFIKKEKPLWAGRPDPKIIEGKAWIGLVVGPIMIVFGLSICLGTSGMALFVMEHTMTKVIMLGFGALFGLMFPAVGALAIVFRKRIGGNVNACYVVTNQRAYICDGSGPGGGGAVRAFTPQQLTDLRVEVSTKFEGAGDLIFAYDFMGEQGVMANKEALDRLESRGHSARGTAVGFLSIANVELVRKMIDEVLVEPVVEKHEAKAKARKKKQKEKENYKPFG
jgi:hypothetical protein